MYPTLLQFGSIAISTKSVFVVLAFLVTAFVFWRKTREEHYLQDQAFDAFLLTSMVGLVMGRVGFVIQHLSEFGFNLWHWLDVVNHPGSSISIGLLGASLYLYRYAGKQKWDQFEVLDYWFLAVAAGMVLRQIGNFFAGVGFGYQTNLPWGMVFPGVFTKYHPVQLYSTLFFLALYIYLSWAEYNYRTFVWYKAGKKTAQTGFLSCVFMIAVGGFMSLMQFIKPPQLVWKGINFDLLLYLLLLVGGGIIVYLKSGRSFKLFGKNN
ncbi:prolipoprotein diacylglyceryl transferase [Patescibacteria group bacterium]|nr:prolipoprotein diacylglyceryl transferase [Patescibacteria group bacterium]MBU1967474.1 prolipoprotein diacylglyceryl transferase [Patescibacteria group bacterium]MBU2542983.1 prolipoprotein diacylglyceryl transferase [Patescibacteria group bacterium]